MCIKAGTPVVYFNTTTGYQNLEVLKHFRKSKVKELRNLKKDDQFWTEISAHDSFCGVSGFMLVIAKEIVMHGKLKEVFWSGHGYLGSVMVLPHNPERTLVFQVKQEEKLEELILADQRIIALPELAS
jgi:hypothetical protein